MKNRRFTTDVGIALLAVAMVIVAFVLANWADLTTGPNDVQAAVDTAASHADAIAAAKVAHAVRVAAAQPALPH